jgi:hypothetical protein
VEARRIGIDVVELGSLIGAGVEFPSSEEPPPPEPPLPPALQAATIGIRSMAT